ncbi:MAG: hypothetical protein R3B90_11285 [Planctomycetaceae bacterium]
MQLTYPCHRCDQLQRTTVAREDTSVTCAACHYVQSLPAGAWQGEQPARCLGCGNEDLWRQKDFSQALGLLMVAAGAIFSSIAWAYHYPAIALGILAGFGLLDMVLYWVMPDVLVCYRCQARHHVGTADENFGAYNHELGERYRQERLRTEQTGGSPPAGPAAPASPSH